MFIGEYLVYLCMYITISCIYYNNIVNHLKLGKQLLG